MAVANSQELDGRIAILYHCMASLTIYLLKVANLRTVDRHLRYPGKLRSEAVGHTHADLLGPPPLGQVGGCAHRVVPQRPPPFPRAAHTLAPASQDAI